MLRFHKLTRALLALFVLFVGMGATPTHLRGIRQVGSGDQEGSRLYSWDEQIQWLDSDRTLFTQVLMKLGNKDVDDPELKVRERQHPSRWFRATEALDASETDITCAAADAKALRVNDVLLVTESNERLLVTAVAAASFTVTRAQQGTTGTVTVSTTPWLKILYSKETEGGTKPNIVTTDSTTQTNWTQIFKRGWGQTGTDKATKKRAGMTLAEEQKLALELLREDMEQAFLWGRKREEVSSGTYTRYTGGIDEFVTTNRIDLEGGIGYGDIGYLMNVATRFGGAQKIWLCGRDARQQIDSLNLKFLQVGPKDNFLGMSVKKFETSFGEAMLLTHHGLDNGHADRIFVIDPKHVKKATLRAIKPMRDVQTPGTDGEEHYFLTETGLWINQELAHMVITGVTSKIS